MCYVLQEFEAVTKGRKTPFKREENKPSSKLKTVKTDCVFIHIMKTLPGECRHIKHAANNLGAESGKKEIYIQKQLSQNVA